MSHTERVIALIDMDCFYCQVEEKLDPNLSGKPIAVVQYNQWRGGGIIAVNYLARDKGVTRQMRGDEAKEKCPDIQLPRVPQIRGKADLTKYREAGKQVAEVLKSFTNILERASIDEAYLDLTEAVKTEIQNGLPFISTQDVSNTFVVGQETADYLANISQNQNSGFFEDDMKLLVGGLIVERIRAEVFEKTGYRCSAGIAHNKILAKLVCGLHKPNKQTILPQGAVPEMFANLPIRKIKNLGGKFGNTLSETLNINYIGELLKFSEKELIQRFDERTGRWLYNIARGIDREPVQVKLISKSIGCCKRFPGKTALCKPDEVEHWMKELSTEISERLEEDMKENNRKGKLVTVSFWQERNQGEINSTRAVPLKSYEMEKIRQQAMEVLNKFCQKADGSFHITFLGLSISNFEDIKNVKTITSYFRKIDKGTSNITRNNIKQDNALAYSSAQSEMKNEEIVKDSSCNSDTLDSEGNSIYSTTTVELDEEPEDLIFFNDNMRNTDTIDQNQGMENKGLDSVDTDEQLSNQYLFDNPLDTNNFSTSDSPVFRSCINEEADEDADSSNEIERNFDTSKIFSGLDQSSDEELNGNNVYAEEVSDFVELSENCKECGQVIPIVDIVSHMDFHLALKLSQEMLPEESSSTMNKPKREEKPSTKKRKITESCGSIQSFYKKHVVEPDEITEICSECNKRIRIDDVATHYDYHAAKKLHLELNSPSSKERLPTKKYTASTSTLPNNKQSKKKMKSNMNITTFFKQLDS